jgi:PhnB protein
MSVKAIPEGYHSITPHMIIRDCAKAIEFYKTAFDAKQQGETAFGPDGKVMHAALKIGDSIVMMSDEFPQSKSLGPLSLGGSAIVLNIYTDNADKLWERAVKAGATITMPLSNQFWGDRYGQLVDPFGHRWSIAQHVEDVRPEDMPARMQRAMEEFKAQKQSQGASA